MNEFVAKACISLRPEAGVSVDEHGIHWYNVDIIPTQQEIEAETLRLQNVWNDEQETKQNQPTNNEIIASLVARIAALETK